MKPLKDRGNVDEPAVDLGLVDDLSPYLCVAAEIKPHATERRTTEPK